MFLQKRFNLCNLKLKMIDGTIILTLQSFFNGNTVYEKFNLILAGYIEEKLYLLRNKMITTVLGINPLIR